MITRTIIHGPRLRIDKSASAVEHCMAGKPRPGGSNTSLGDKIWQYLVVKLKTHNLIIK